MRSLVNSCNGFYTLSKEDKTNWNIPGWIPLEDPKTWQNISKLMDVCPKPWRYVSKNVLENGYSMAEHGFYGGGGYVAELGYNQRTARMVKCIFKVICLIKIKQNMRNKVPY